MRLPDELRDKVAEICSRIAPRELALASQSLSQRYRFGEPAAALFTTADRIAYLAVRLAATYAAVRTALAEADDSLPGWSPKTLCDLGCGPGTALWAACELFPSLVSLDATERDLGFLSLARELASASPDRRLRETTWTNKSIQQWHPTNLYDLVIASYALGELTSVDRKFALVTAWKACEGALVIAEPGTPRGFATIAEARDLLIGLGASIAAPCPHALECPMRAVDDWCHFSARVERSAEHRRLKQAELGYEDEKFSYIVATKLPAHPTKGRIVRHPLRYSGYTRLKLCTPGGLKEETVTRSQKDRYRTVKKCDWGSRLDES